MAKTWGEALKYMALRADDGTPLTTKEGVVLDNSGRPLTRGPLQSQFTSAGRSFTLVSKGLSLPLVVGLVVFVPLLIAAGFAVVTIGGILLTLAFVNQRLGRLFRSNR
jgi:hypothetical protein